MKLPPPPCAVLLEYHMFIGHFSILLLDVVGTMVADEPPEDVFEAGWCFLRNLADRIEDVSISDEEAGEHSQMLTDV